MRILSSLGIFILILTVNPPELNAYQSVDLSYSISIKNDRKARKERRKNKRRRAKDKATGKVLKGKASYYADKFHGRKTASGEIFSQNEFTAAHKTLPFNTRVKVTNLDNGKSVIVRINDRGPFVKGRIIDLSRCAAKKIDIVKVGVANVKVEILK